MKTLIFVCYFGELTSSDRQSRYNTADRRSILPTVAAPPQRTNFLFVTGSYATFEPILRFLVVMLVLIYMANYAFEVLLAQGSR